MAILDESDFADTAVNTGSNILSESDFADSATPSTLDTINAVSGQLGKGASLGLMNRIEGAEAGARNWLAGLFGAGNEKSFSENYNEVLKQRAIEDAAFEAANPVTSTALQLGGAIIPGLVTGGATFAPNVGNKGAQILAKNLFGVGSVANPTLKELAKVGAIQSGIYNAANAQEGQALEEGLMGAAKGVLFSPVGKVATMAGDKIANVADDVGTRFKMAALGIDKADVTNAFKSQPEGVQYFPKLLSDLEKSGTFKQGFDYQAIEDAIKTQVKAKGKETSSIVNLTNDLASAGLPNFNSAEKLISKLDGSSQKMAKQVFEEEILDLIDTMKNGGSIKDWQKVKQSFQGQTKYGKDSLPIRADIKKAIASDARQHIEDSAEQFLGKEAAQQLKQTNKEIGGRLTILDILDEAKIRQSAQNPVNSLREIFKTTGGFGVPILLGGAEYLRSGDPTQALAAGIGGGYLTSPKGQFKIGNLVKGTGQKINTAANVLAKSPKGVLFDSKQDSTFSLPTQGPTVMPKADDIDLDSIPKKKADRVAFIESQIDSDPIDAAIYEIESGRNPLAKNPTSSASGAFQLINRTAKKLGVEDPFDIAQNYKGYLKLKEEHQGVLRKLGIDENDPEALYSLHYLGSPTFKKLMKGNPLTEKEAGHVRYLESKVLPRFRKVYQSKLVNV